MEFIEINNKNVSILQDFIFNINSKHFRYFNNRDIDVVKNHILTLVVKYNGELMGYFHIDYEDKNWLGICIYEEFQSQGFGKKIMTYGLENEKVRDLPVISLTVDKDNIPAVKLYEKFGFKILNDREDKTYYYMERSI